MFREVESLETAPPKASPDPPGRPDLRRDPELRADPDLLSSVCHDLKAPLASITMGVAFLRRVLPHTDDPTSRVVDALHRASHRMARTVASFADLAKLQMGELDLDLRPTPVGEVMQTAFDAFLPEARADQTTIALDVDPAISSSKVACDPARLVQVMWHLFACVTHVAVSKEPVTLRATSAESERGVRFEVERLGLIERAGLPAAPMPKPELAIAKGLVALHGGTLDVRSEGGTLRLSFVVPLSPALSAASKGPPDGN